MTARNRPIGTRIVLRQLAFRNVAKYPGKLVGQEDHQQNHRDPEPGHGDFAKNVPVEDALHRIGNGVVAVGLNG